MEAFGFAHLHAFSRTDSSRACAQSESLCYRLHLDPCSKKRPMPDWKREARLTDAQCTITLELNALVVVFELRSAWQINSDRQPENPDCTLEKDKTILALLHEYSTLIRTNDKQSFCYHFVTILLCKQVSKCLLIIMIIMQIDNHANFWFDCLATARSRCDALVIIMHYCAC
jgi:hypothetical protein